MNSDAIDCTLMGFVMLNDLLRPYIVHSNVFGLGRGDYALLCWVEDCFSDGRFVTVVFLDAFLALDVPYHHLFVLTA